MGRSRRQQQQAHAAAAGGGHAASERKAGCNSPAGCVVGASIPAGALSLPADCVPAVCDSTNCPAVRYLHAECVRRWEDCLIAALRKTAPKSVAGQRDEALRSQLWSAANAKRVHSSCKCPAAGCTGYLRRDVKEEHEMSARHEALKQATARHGGTGTRRAQSSGADGDMAVAAAGSLRELGKSLAPAVEPPDDPNNAHVLDRFKVNPASQGRYNAPNADYSGQPQPAVGGRRRKPKFEPFHKTWRDDRDRAPPPADPALDAGFDHGFPITRLDVSSSPPADPNDLDEFPPISDAMRPASAQRQQQSQSASYANAMAASAAVAPHSPAAAAGSGEMRRSELTAAEAWLVDAIGQLVRCSPDERVWREDQRLIDLLNVDDAQLLQTFAQTEFDDWLRSNTDMHVINGSLVLKSSGQLQTTCKVNRIHEPHANRQPPHAHMSDRGELGSLACATLILFDTRSYTSAVTRNDNDGGDRAKANYFAPGDYVLVTAEMLQEPWHGCTHRATTMELVQRCNNGESSAQSARCSSGPAIPANSGKPSNDSSAASGGTLTTATGGPAGPFALPGRTLQAAVAKTRQSSTSSSSCAPATAAVPAESAPARPLVAASHAHRSPHKAAVHFDLGTPRRPPARVHANDASGGDSVDEDNVSSTSASKSRPTSADSAQLSGQSANGLAARSPVHSAPVDYPPQPPVQPQPAPVPVQPVPVAAPPVVNRILIPARGRGRGRAMQSSQQQPPVLLAGYFCRPRPQPPDFGRPPAPHTASVMPPPQCDEQPQPHMPPLSAFGIDE